MHRALTAIVVLSTISISAAGCASTVSPPASQAPAASVVPSEAASASAGSAADPKATSTTLAISNYEFGLTKESISNLLNEDLTAFNQRPISERVTLAMYYAQSLPKFASDWESISHNPNGALPANINKNNSVDEIISFISMQRRQALTIPAADGYSLDFNTSDKLFSSTFISGSSSDVYKNLTKYSRTLMDNGGRVMSARTLAVNGIFPEDFRKVNSQSDKYIDADGSTCVDINSTSLVGTNLQASNFTACLVSNQHGSIWIQK